MKQIKSTSMIVAVTAIVLAIAGLFLVYGNFSSKSINRISRAKVARTATTTGSALEVNAQTNSNVMYVKWDKINVYKRKSESSAVVKALKCDKKVVLLNQADSNGWVKIKIPNGKKGYVFKKQLSEKKRKKRCEEDCVLEWEVTKPKIRALGWEIMSDGEIEVERSGATWAQACQTSWLSKGEYTCEVINFSKINDNYMDGRIRRVYGWNIYKNGEFVSTSFGESWTTRRGFLHSLSEC